MGMAHAMRALRAASATARALSTSASTYTVPAAALESFRTRGWAVLPKFLSADELAPISATYDKCAPRFRTRHASPSRREPREPDGNTRALPAPQS